MKYIKALVITLIDEFKGMDKDFRFIILGLGILIFGYVPIYSMYTKGNDNIWLIASNIAMICVLSCIILGFYYSTKDDIKRHISSFIRKVKSNIK